MFPLKGTVLPRETLLKLLQREPPLVEGLTNIEEQVQPNGIDLTVSEVALLCSAGQLGAGNEQRRLSGLAPLTFDSLGFMELLPGAYLVTLREAVHLPEDIMALGRPRSSLLRCGVALHTAVWDAGYSGRSQCLMIVYNPFGFRLARGARLLQLVFFLLTEKTGQGYAGLFQGENP